MVVQEPVRCRTRAQLRARTAELVAHCRRSFAEQMVMRDRGSSRASFIGGLDMMARRIGMAVIALPLAVLPATAATAASSSGADECLSGPRGAAPKGEHWYYRLDRATRHKCWFTSQASPTAHRAASARRGVERRRHVAERSDVRSGRETVGRMASAEPADEIRTRSWTGFLADEGAAQSFDPHASSVAEDRTRQQRGEQKGEGVPADATPPAPAGSFGIADSMEPATRGFMAQELPVPVRTPRPEPRVQVAAAVAEQPPTTGPGSRTSDFLGMALMFAGALILAASILASARSNWNRVLKRVAAVRRPGRGGTGGRGALDKDGQKQDRSRAGFTFGRGMAG